jgi:hypothetical protein
VAAVSEREKEPRGTIVPDAVPEVGDPVMEILVSLTVVYATPLSATTPNDPS